MEKTSKQKTTSHTSTHTNHRQRLHANDGDEIGSQNRDMTPGNITNPTVKILHNPQPKTSFYDIQEMFSLHFR